MGRDFVALFSFRRSSRASMLTAAVSFRAAWQCATLGTDSTSNDVESGMGATTEMIPK
jgi:hypothetical protein